MLPLADTHHRPPDHSMHASSPAKFSELARRDAPFPQCEGPLDLIRWVPEASLGREAEGQAPKRGDSPITRRDKVVRFERTAETPLPCPIRPGVSIAALPPTPKPEARSQSGQGVSRFQVRVLRGPGRHPPGSEFRP